MKALLVALAVVLGAQAAEAAQIDPALLAFAQGRTEARALRVVLVLKTRTAGLPVPRRYDSPQVLSYLRALSSQAFTDLRQYLGTQADAPTQIRLVSSYWINSTVSADVTPAGLRILADAPAVTKIYANRFVRNEPDQLRRVTRPQVEDTLTYDFAQTGLDRLMQSDPSIDGRGVILGHLDTGVDGTHPALQGKILKFWNAATKQFGQPIDTAEHGTHTAGTMVGGDRVSNFIGVAPGAKLISAAGLSDFDGMLASMQFFLDPDGDPSTNDSPRAINNSWNCDGAPDVELFYTAIGAWEAAGILPVFSAGNSGPNLATITHPHEYPGAFDVGSTGADGLVSDFSSRGPGTYNGVQTQKPDLSAPGDNIRSSLPGGTYGEMSGTSMATPHVTGATALLLQVDPSLTPDQLRKILLGSTDAVDLNGQPEAARAWNANYGLGKMDIFAAVQLAKQVRVQKFLGGTNELARFLGLFGGPVTTEVDSILRDDGPSVERIIQFPAALEGTEWLTPAQVWGL